MKNFNKYVLVLLLVTVFPINASAEQQGRYQIVINPSSVRAGTFLLDTTTGKVWKKGNVENTDNQSGIWLTMDRIDDSKEWIEWQKKHSKTVSSPNAGKSVDDKTYNPYADPNFGKNITPNFK